MPDPKKPSLLERARAAQTVRREQAEKDAAVSNVPRRGIPPTPPASSVPTVRATAPSSPPKPNVATVGAVGPRIDFGDSSNIKSAELDEKTGHVAVEFMNGATATFAGFSVEMLKSWNDAPSPGTWFHQNVRSKPAVHVLVAKTAAPTVPIAVVNPAPVAPAASSNVAPAGQADVEHDVAPSSSSSSSATPEPVPASPAPTVTAAAPAPVPAPPAQPVTVRQTVTPKPPQQPPKRK